MFRWSYIVMSPFYLMQLNRNSFVKLRQQRIKTEYIVHIIHGSTTQLLDDSTLDLLIHPCGVPRLRQDDRLARKYRFPKPFEPMILSMHMCFWLETEMA